MVVNEYSITAFRVKNLRYFICITNSMAFECETEKWQNLFWVIYWGHSKNEGGFPIEIKTKI